MRGGREREQTQSSFSRNKLHVNSFKHTHRHWFTLGWPSEEEEVLEHFCCLSSFDSLQKRHWKNRTEQNRTELNWIQVTSKPTLYLSPQRKRTVSELETLSDTCITWNQCERNWVKSHTWIHSFSSRTVNTSNSLTFIFFSRILFTFVFLPRILFSWTVQKRKDREHSGESSANVALYFCRTLGSVLMCISNKHWLGANVSSFPQFFFVSNPLEITFLTSERS